MEDFRDPLREKGARVSAGLSDRTHRTQRTRSDQWDSSVARGTAATNLLLDVVEGVGGVDGKADEDDVGVGVRQRSETVVVFLTCRIPQG